MTKSYFQIALYLNQHGYTLCKTPITNLCYVFNSDGYLIDLLKDGKIDYFWSMGAVHIKTGRLGQKLRIW